MQSPIERNGWFPWSESTGDCGWLLHHSSKVIYTSCFERGCIIGIFNIKPGLLNPRLFLCGGYHFTCQLPVTIHLPVTCWPQFINQGWHKSGVDITKKIFYMASDPVGMGLLPWRLGIWRGILGNSHGEWACIRPSGIHWNTTCWGRKTCHGTSNHIKPII